MLHCVLRHPKSVGKYSLWITYVRKRRPMSTALNKWPVLWVDDSRDLGIFDDSESLVEQFVWMSVMR
jgi:hypothetical protein